MAVDRVHRTPRLLGIDEKGILRDVENGGPVRLCVGGVVLNHLGWAAVLGLRTGIFGKQADDEGGRFLRSAMDRIGIERDIVLDGSASSVAEIFVDDAGSRTIYMAPGATLETSAEHVRRHHARFIERSERLSTEVSQLPLVATREALAIARAAGIEKIVDLDVPPSDAVPTLGDEATLQEVLAAADVLKPSKLAAREFVSGGREAEDALNLARIMRARFGNRAVVVTDGEAGCAISAEGFEARVAGFSVKPVDTTGAGDAFLGGLLAGLHHGLDWETTGRLANACGAACSEQVGAFPEDPAAARARILDLFDVPAGLILDPLPPQVVSSPDLVAAERVLLVAAEEIAALCERHDGAAFKAAADLIERALSAGGRVHVTGVGKPEHVARYGASLLSSTGVPASFLHATETVHGSLGQVVAGDVVVAISNSGETPELRQAVEALTARAARLIAITGRPDSWLARQADVVLDAGVDREGGPLELAPRASVAAEVLVIAALGAELQERSGFSKADYAARHPAGKLGRRARS